MNSSVIEGILLLNDSNLESLQLFLKNVSLRFLPVFFLIGLLCEYLREYDFPGVLKSAIIAVILITSFSTYFPKLLKDSFSISDELVNKYAKNSQFLKDYWQARKDTHKSKNIDYLASLFELWGEGVLASISSGVFGSGFLYVIMYFSFFLIKYIYTFSLEIFTALFPITCLISVLPGFKNVLGGTIKTGAWILLTPVCLAIMLILISSVHEHYTYDWLNLSKFMHLGMISLFIVLSPVFAWAIVAGSGIGDVSQKMLGGAGFGMAVSGLKFGSGMVFKKGIPIAWNKFREKGLQRAEPSTSLKMAGAQSRGNKLETVIKGIDSLSRRDENVTPSSVPPETISKASKYSSISDQMKGKMSPLASPRPKNMNPKLNRKT